MSEAATRRFVPWLLLAGALGCSAAPPAKPSWAEDVEPIIRGSCAQCHGASYKATSGGLDRRLDICDSAAFKEELGIDLPANLGAKAIKPATFRQVLRSGPKRMPPPPALILGDYEQQVIENWLNDGLCGKRPHNQKPRLKERSRLVDGTVLKVTVEVFDADGETVLGKLTSGGAEGAILQSGRSVVWLEGASKSDIIHYKIFDGTDAVEGDLQPDDAP